MILTPTSPHYHYYRYYYYYYYMAFMRAGCFFLVAACFGERDYRHCCRRHRRHRGHRRRRRHPIIASTTIALQRQLM